MTFTAPAHDHPFQGEMPTPDFAEAQMWNFTDGRYGIIYHLGTLPGDLRLWHNAFAITCPDGSVLATKIVGPSESGMFGTRTAHSRTIDPYRTWRIEFDGALRRYGPADLSAGPGADGRHIPAKVTLDVTAAYPVWEPGLRSGDEEGSLFRTIYHMHHEQALKTTGTIEIDGERVAFKAIGHRDHSFGPRDITKVIRGHWINASFDSGWAFLGMDGSMDPTGAWERAAVFEHGRVVDAAMVHAGELSSTAPEPRQFEMTLRTEDRVRTIRVTCTDGVNWFGAGPSEFCVGNDYSDPKTYNWAMYFAEFECDGERGKGLVDRGAQAALLRWP